MPALSAPEKRDTGPVVLVFALAGSALLVRVLSDGVPDAGDGVGHYQLARFAWKHPHVLFDNWGKPLFTLLGSPFAQWGMWGLALFNALVAAFTARLIIDHIAGISRAWRWAVPIFLFASVQYAHTVMAGLTEPLFGLLAIAAVLCALRDRWPLALGIASFLPFARPEYVALLPILVITGAWQRQWRALPWVFLGTVFYMLFAVMLTGDPLLVFRGDTYLGKDLYGAGDAPYFIQRMSDVIGAPMIVVTIVALIACAVLIVRDRAQRKLHLRVVWLALIPALGILAAHSYAWWKGGYGSAGLERVLATGVPLLVLFAVHVLASAWRSLRPARLTDLAFAGALAVFASFAFPQMVDSLRLPYRSDRLQTTRREAAMAIGEVRMPGERLYYLTPYLGVLCGVDPMDSTEAVMLYGPRSVDDAYGIRSGDLVAWDAHHARMEGYLPADSLLLSDRFRLLQTFMPPEETMVLGGVPYEILLFRREAVERSLLRDTLYAIGRPTSGMIAEQTDPTDPGVSGLTIGASEYPFGFRNISLGKDRSVVRERLVVRGSVTGSFAREKLDLVFTETKEGAGVRYATLPLTGGAFEVSWDALPNATDLQNKLYVWNRSGLLVHFDKLEVIREGLLQRSPTGR